MFRDLKEYQEIAKIYAEKVSKPENLDERVRGGGVSSAPKIEPATPPQKGFGGGVGNRTNRRGSGARNNRKPEKKMSNIPVIDGPVNNPEYGKNMSRDEKDLNPPENKKPDPKPIKKMHPIEKKNRLRMGDAKVDALKAKNTDFKAMRKGTMSKDDFIKKYPKSITAQKAKGLRDHTEWEPYDYVLEYLLSSEQAATIEEANYVMTEMDAETIQGIVEEQKKNFDEGLGKAALIGTGLYLGYKGLKKAGDSFNQFLNNQRDNSPIGGNKRVDDTRKGSGDKKVGEKIKFGK